MAWVVVGWVVLVVGAVVVAGSVVVAAPVVVVAVAPRSSALADAAAANAASPQMRTQTPFLMAHSVTGIAASCAGAYENSLRKKKAIRRQMFIECSCFWIGATASPSSSRSSAPTEFAIPPFESASISALVAGSR